MNVDAAFFASHPPIFVIYLGMDSGREAFPDDIEALKAALVAARDKHIVEATRAAHAEAELAVARAKTSDDQALIAHQHSGQPDVGQLRTNAT